MRQELCRERMTDYGRDIKKPWCRSNSRGCSRHWCNLTQVHRLRRRAWLVSDRRQECWCTDSLLCCLPWEKPLWRDLVQSQSLAEGRRRRMNEAIVMYLGLSLPAPLSLRSLLSSSSSPILPPPLPLSSVLLKCYDFSTCNIQVQFLNQPIKLKNHGTTTKY